jgi:hypothetical protein
MDMMEFDLTQEEVPNGVYEGKIVKAVDHTAKNGNTCLKLSVVLSNEQGTKMDKYITTAKADGSAVSINPIRQLARAIGESASLFSLGEKEGDEYTKFKGIDVRVNVENQPDLDGWPKPSVKALLPYAQA